MSELSSEGLKICVRVECHTQLTLFQPGGTDYAHLITTGTPGFLDLPTALHLELSVAISQKNANMQSVSQFLKRKMTGNGNEQKNLRTDIVYYVLSSVLHKNGTPRAFGRALKQCSVMQN